MFTLFLGTKTFSPLGLALKKRGMGKEITILFLYYVKVIRRLKKSFRHRSEFIGCIDTCFIEGSILKMIEKKGWGITIKDDFSDRLKKLNDLRCLLLVNPLNEFEIKNKLIKEFNISFERANKIYETIKDKIPNLKRIEIDEIKITSSLINWMLKNRLTLRDGLLITIAQK